MNAGTAVLAGSAVASVGGDFFSKTIAGKLFSTLGNSHLLSAGVSGCSGPHSRLPCRGYRSFIFPRGAIVASDGRSDHHRCSILAYADVLPNRSGGLAGTGLEKALVALLAVLIRPALIIVGLVFCMPHACRPRLFERNHREGTVALFGVSSDALVAA